MSTTDKHSARSGSESLKTNIFEERVVEGADPYGFGVNRNLGVNVGSESLKDSPYQRAPIPAPRPLPLAPRRPPRVMETEIYVNK